MLAADEQLVDACTEKICFPKTTACKCQHEYDCYLFIFERRNLFGMCCRLKKSKSRSVHIRMSMIVTVTTFHSNVDCLVGAAAEEEQ